MISWAAAQSECGVQGLDVILARALQGIITPLALVSRPSQNGRHAGKRGDTCKLAVLSANRLCHHAGLKQFHEGKGLVILGQEACKIGRPVQGPLAGITGLEIICFAGQAEDRIEQSHGDHNEDEPGIQNGCQPAQFMRA